MRHTSATAAFLASAVIGALGLTPAAAHAGSGPPEARAAWIKSCTGKNEDTRPCGHWRLLLRDGRQVAVPGTAASRVDGKGAKTGDASAFAISANGRVMAYERAGDHRLVVRRVAGGPATVLPKQPKGVGTDEIALYLSPAGDRVLIEYTDDPARLPTKVITVATGKVTTLPAQDGVQGFSGDGDEVLTVRSRNDNTTTMYAYRLDGGGSIRQTPPQVVANALAYALAPDGKTVAAFTSGNADRNKPPRVRIYDLETGDLSAGADLPLKPDMWPYALSWTGERLNAVVSSGDDGDPAVVRVLTVDPESGTATRADSYTISKTRYGFVVAGE